MTRLCWACTQVFVRKQWAMTSKTLNLTRAKLCLQMSQCIFSFYRVNFITNFSEDWRMYKLSCFFLPCFFWDPSQRPCHTKYTLCVNDKSNQNLQMRRLILFSVFALLIDSSHYGLHAYMRICIILLSCHPTVPLFCHTALLLTFRTRMGRRIYV